MDKLYIGRFPLKNEPIELDIKPMTILTGRNNFRKSSIIKAFEASLTLVAEDAPLYGIGACKNGKQGEEYDWLSNIIKIFNETYGLNLSEYNKEDFEKIRKQIDSNDQLMSFFSPVNSRDNIRDKFYEVLDDALLQFVNVKLELYNKLTEDKANATMKRLWFNELYDQRVRRIGQT